MTELIEQREPVAPNEAPPSQPSEVGVGLRKSFLLFPPERTRTETLGEPNDEQHEISLSSVVIHDSENDYRFTLDIAGSYSAYALDPRINDEESEAEETSLNDADRIAEIEEIKRELKKRGGELGIDVETSSLSDNMLAKDGEDETTPQLTKAAIVFLGKLRFVIIRDGREKRIKPTINDTFTGASFRLRYPLEDVARDEVGKIRGKVILIGRNK